MKTKTAVLLDGPGRWEIADVELDDPRDGEILVRMVAAGLCHSDDHFATGDIPLAHYPFAGGHEGAGIVEAVGPGVRTVKPGDHVIASLVPSCGRCRFCADGAQNLCDQGSDVINGSQLDGSFRMHLDGRDVGQCAFTSTFSEYTVMPEHSAVRVPDDIPLEIAALVGCGVPTGWGSAVNAAEVRGGDAVIVMGVGGVGINAVQGAVHAGASVIVAVDPVQAKRDFAVTFGATHGAATMAEAAELVRAQGAVHGADSVIICVGVVTGADVAAGVDAVRKGGSVVIAAAGKAMDAEGVPVSLLMLTMLQKRIQGAHYGMMSPNKDVPRLLTMWKSGQLKLEELVSRTYTLDQINEGYDDLRAGRNMRGIITFGAPAADDRSARSGDAVGV